MKKFFILCVLLVTALITVQAQTQYVNVLGAATGWYSDDTRNTSGTDLVGLTRTLYGKPGQTPTAADDITIDQQLQFVAGPAGGLYGGTVKIIAPSGYNSAKSTISTVNLGGFAAASDLVGGSFSATYKWYVEKVSTWRSVAFRIGIQSTQWTASQTGFTATRSGEQTWDLILVNLGSEPTPTADGWFDVTVDKDNGVWYLYRQAGNTYFPAPPAGQTLAQWQADATWGPLLFGAGAKITNVQFGLGSGQQGCNAYVDYLQTTILNGGNVIDFVAPVHNITQGTFHGTIQLAINAANSGDEIHVPAGTFVENNFGWTGLQVTKSLKIVGAGSASTIVKVANKTNGIEFPGNMSIWLEGMTFTKDGTTGPGFFIRLGEVASTYSDVTFKDLIIEYATGRNVMLDQNGVYTGGLIENCIIRNSGRWGFSLNYPSTAASGLTFKNSSFLNNGTADGDMNSIGLDLQKASNIGVENCLFDGNLAKGISLGAVNNCTFTNVTVSNNGHPTTAMSNRNGVSFWEFVGTSSNISFVNPTIINNGRGIMLGTQAASNTITNFTVTNGYFNGNAAQNLLVYQSVPAGLISGVKLNKSYMGSPYFWGNSPAAIDFSANWWESADQSTVSSRANGALNDYTPYLDSGTDTDISTPGFQPDLSTLWVYAGSPQL